MPSADTDTPVIATVPVLDEDSVLSVVPLSEVREGGGVVIGDPATGVFVTVPPIAVEVVGLLRAGSTVGETKVQITRRAGEDVDVLDFAATMLELGYAAVLPAGGAPPPSGPLPSRPHRITPAKARWAFSRPAWTGYGAALAMVVAILSWRGDLFPHFSDLFFLATPARSIAALTLITFALAAAHEGWHWLAARAVDVDATITLSRRLYFLTFETDLTGLWAVPRRRRFSPLFAGMAFDVVVLAGLLVGRLGGVQEWWHLPQQADGALAALALLQLTALVGQCFIFLRTDVYAVFVTATGCANLSRVTQLSLLRLVRLARPQHERELAAAQRRDLAVARWYRWVHIGGLLLAAWYLVMFFVPATLRTLGWIATTVGQTSPATWPFWEALALGSVMLAPRVLTAGLALRDLASRRRNGAEVLG